MRLFIPPEAGPSRTPSSHPVRMSSCAAQREASRWGRQGGGGSVTLSPETELDSPCTPRYL
ncbi:hypothetical protein T484DRAFT_1923518 [Baffinella frigidus]|nr:hypothetical protein T484DRAFT_1923518 [Cryptophyta sp. CCMP2293]